ncbi:hypothetical protein K461DRAFT_267156 [Myriangium duriaei CBS 260.36]|uniref:Uncharacterized protein n=1 Tax=Myriangium duriaei CBS 260.36 TaxID=1168546 RepID=A0A9P4MIE2_9PEZI|nr:hypothetical protein K461DRAFT_267156 [Myriangium duriaei CBS 260.36]
MLAPKQALFALTCVASTTLAIKTVYTVTYRNERGRIINKSRSGNVPDDAVAAITAGMYRWSNGVYNAFRQDNDLRVVNVEPRNSLRDTAGMLHRMECIIVEHIR